MKYWLRTLLLFLLLLTLWQGIIWLGQIPDYFLPAPWQVILTLIHQASLLFKNAMVTLGEAVLGFLLALLGGAFAAILAFRFRPVGFLLMPVLIISQALPTFAIAPLLILWLGYGLASKVILVAIMVFFPISAALFDGLKRVEPLWLTMANLMASKQSRILWYVQLPGALPHFASGVRIAAAGAMMGAIIGEWVGASQGLGFILLEANARLETSMVFASLLLIVILSLSFYKLVDILLKQLITW